MLSFESRRSAEIARLIESCGGKALVAPATKEVPAAKANDVSRFVIAVLNRQVDLVIFLTGVGARALANSAESVCSREQFISALSRIPVLARGPKPVAALRELGVPITYQVPEPNTWREILQVLDDEKISLRGKHVAVQEYGVPSAELMDGLRQRGAEVLAVHVYDWALPEDTSALKKAIASVVEGSVDVVLFTAAVQVHHLLQMADEIGSRDELVAGLRKAKVASIGPVTSKALAEYGVPVHLEPTHPKMGFLVKEAAERFGC